MIECPKCQFDNDLGRIFCSKCGEKLDISKVSAPKGAQRRAKKGKKAESTMILFTGMLTKAVKMLVLAMVAAVLTALMLPPNLDRKVPLETSFETYREKRTKLEEAIASQEAVSVPFTEGELNIAMAQAVQVATKGVDSTKGLMLESVYITLGQDTITGSAQNKWRWFRLYLQVRAKPVNQGGKWMFKPEGAWIGRLRVPTMFTDKVSGAMGVLFKDLETERSWMEQCEKFEVKPGELILTPRKTES